MSLEELIKKLSQVFEVEEDDLGGCLEKTDLTDLDEQIPQSVRGV